MYQVGDCVTFVVDVQDERSGLVTWTRSIDGHVAVIVVDAIDPTKVAGYDISVLTASLPVWKLIPVAYLPQSVQKELFVDYTLIHITACHVMGPSGTKETQTRQAELEHCFPDKTSPYTCLVQYYDRAADKTVAGRIVEFGLDRDNLLKAVITVSEKTDLDCKFEGGYFSHVPLVINGTLGVAYPLYKLQFAQICNMWDERRLGEMNYYNVLKHVVCDNWKRYRIQTIKRPTPLSPPPGKKGPDPNFFFGFTEDGFHFARQGYRRLQTAFPGEEDDPSEWMSLELDPSIEEPFIKRGFIIYGREVVRPGKKTTLEWCLPPPGFDLLRVFLATSGQCPIFKNLSGEQIQEKLLAKDGSKTLAYNLFQGIVGQFLPVDELNPSNEAIEFIKRRLLW